MSLCSDFLFLISFIHALFLYNTHGKFTECLCYLEEKRKKSILPVNAGMGIRNLGWNAAIDKQLRCKTQLLTTYWLRVEFVTVFWLIYEGILAKALHIDKGNYENTVCF